MQPWASESARRINQVWRAATRHSPEGDADTSPNQKQDFIPYPVRRVVGTVADVEQAEATVKALVEAGFDRQDIEFLHGDEGLRRLDPARTEHGLIAHVQRSLVSSLGDFETVSLGRHAEDLRTGKSVIMVRAKGRASRNRAAEVLNAYGAEFIGYYGRWVWELMDAGPAQPAQPAQRTAPERAPDQIYELNFASASMRLQFESAASAVITGSGRPSHAAVMPLRPALYMLTWKTLEGATVVHVHDFESCRAYAVVTERDGSMRRLSGTIKKLT